jgi:sRNA-binding regulator protein Hfq
MTVYFLDGKTLKGKLLKVFQYEIILEVVKSDEVFEVTVFKGAVKYIV